MKNAIVFMKIFSMVFAFFLFIGLMICWFVSVIQSMHPWVGALPMALIGSLFAAIHIFAHK